LAVSSPSSWSISMRETSSGQWFLLQLEPLLVYQCPMDVITGLGSGANKKLPFMAVAGKIKTCGSLFYWAPAFACCLFFEGNSLRGDTFKNQRCHL